MARTPRSAGSEPRVFFLAPANNAFVAERAKESRRSFTEAMNSELDFVQMWGLNRVNYPRLAFAAKVGGVTPMEYVQTLVFQLALTVAPVGPSKQASRAAKSVRRSIIFTAPSLAAISAFGARAGLEFSAALNGLLDFCRTYNLPTNLHAAMAFAAEGRGGSLRDLVLTLISDKVATLPEPPRTSQRG